MEENPMHHYDQLSDAGADSDADSDASADSGYSAKGDASDDSADSADSGYSANSVSSDKSIGHPSSFRNLNLELKRSIEELNSEFDRNHQTLDDKIKELDDTIDELESMHRNTVMGSLVGSSVRAAGGIAAIAGVCLAPFTFGASLALTGVGVVAGVAGGATGAASNITNMFRQKTLREKIEKIINELETTINPTVELLGKILNITEDIKLEEKTLNKLDIQRAAVGAIDVLKIAGEADVAEIGKMCAEVAKEIRVFVKAANAASGPASAARAVRTTASMTKEVRMAAALTSALSAVFLDVYGIGQDSKELSEMNQPAGKRKEEEISSEKLKFILQMKETADQFKKIVKIIKDHTMKINIFN